MKPENEAIMHALLGRGEKEPIYRVVRMMDDKDIREIVDALLLYILWSPQAVETVCALAPLVAYEPMPPTLIEIIREKLSQWRSWAIFRGP